MFLAETPERFALCRAAGRRPAIVSYVGYYRDQAVFALDNGMYACVDLRPELRAVSLRSYYDSCCLAETDPQRAPLPDGEIARLRAIYETADL